MKPKPTLKLSLTKELPKKPKLSIQTPRHKYTSSLFTPKSSVKAILTTKARPSFSSFLIPTTPKSILTAKHHHTMSQQFPINPQSPRLIKITKNEKPDDLTAWKLQDFPVSPEKALFLFKSHLSLVELTEIHKFPEIYWIGIGANKIKSIGFDDEDGDFRLIVNDHISYRYEILQVLGSGSFGRVIKVFDHKAKLEIALKIIKNKPRFHEQAREEIEILNYLKTRDPESNYSIIHLNESFLFRNHIVSSI